MARYIDPLAYNIMLDANVINEVANGSNVAMTRLVELFESDIGVLLILPYSVRREVTDPHAPAAVRKVASTFLETVEVTLTAPERQKLERLVSDAQGNSSRANVERDLFHVFEADKCGGGYFVTRDAWLLRNSERIGEMVHVDVVTPEQIVALIEAAVSRRAGRERMGE